MRAAVRRAFVDFTTHFEGEVATTYCDVKGLITIGIGDLEDDGTGVPPARYLALPFVHADGLTRATRAEKAAEWLMMHNNREELAREGWKAAAKIASLHITAADVATLVLGKLAEDDRYLANRFDAYESWPCDGQLGTLSMAWADGPAFEFPRFAAAVRELDFTAAAAECHMDDRFNPGLKPRNAANVVLFTNAARAIAQGLDPDVLHYPAVLKEEPPASVDVDTTELQAATQIPVELPGVPCDVADPDPNEAA